MSDAIFIDADNALGSPTGDVDDAYAIVALLKSPATISVLGSTHGNTSAERAFRNNSTLAALLGSAVPVLNDVASRDALRTFEGRVAALGPLTNITAAARAREIVLVGGNLTSKGRWPPIWPHEFNLTKDRVAARTLFAGDVPLTIFPLDVASRLWATQAMLDGIPGEIGAFLRRGTRRWMRRLRLVRWTGRFPIYDLAAALYLLGADGLTMEEMTAKMDANTFIRFGVRGRTVNVCRALDRDVLWSRFLALVSAPGEVPISAFDATEF